MRTSSRSRSGCTRSRSASSSGSRSRACATRSISGATSPPPRSRDVLSLRMGATVAGTVRRRVHDARVAQMLDHFTQYVGSSPYGVAGGAVRASRTCRRRRRLVPAGRHPRRARGARAPGRAARRGDPDRRRRAPAADRATAGCRGSRLADGERIALGAVVSNMDAVRTHRELVGGAPAASFARGRRREPACSGVVLYLGLDRGYDHLLHHNFVFSRDAEEEFDWIYRRASRPRTRPAISPRRRAPSPASRRPAARRSTSSSTPPTSVRTTTGTRMLPGLPPDHPRQARAHRGPARPRAPDRGRADA